MWWLLKSLSFSKRITAAFSPLRALPKLWVGLLLVVISIVTLAYPSQNAQAVVGINKQINYQGRLLNAAGAIVADGNYNIQFKLYQDGPGNVAGDTGGTLMWTESRVYGVNTPDNRVNVKNGYFSVSLGSICPFTSTTCTANTGNAQSNTVVDFNQDTLWLSVNIGNTTTAATFAGASGDGELLPMRRMASAVYALQSGSCTTCILQAPTSTAQNTIAPTVNGVTALTITATTGTAANAVSITQGGNATNLTTTNTGATSSSLLSVSQSTSAYAGTAILVNVAAGSGSFASGAFLDLQANGASKFKIDNLGGLTLAGAQAADITTLAGTAPTALVFQPGNNTTATSTGASFTISAGNDSGATAATGGLLTLKGGNATGGGQTGGGVSVDSGTGTTGGTINVGTVNAKTINIGNATSTTTVASQGGATKQTIATAGETIQTSTNSATTLLIQNAGTYNALAFDTTTSTLKVYENVASPTNFASISYAGGAAIFAASSGTTQIGNGTGNVTANLTGAADIYNFNKTYTPAGAYGLNDHTIARTLTGAANALTGSVLQVTDNSTGSASSPNVLYVNQNNASAIGNLIVAKTTGTTTQFSVDTAGNILANGAVNAVTGYKFNGTSGATTTCSGGLFLQNQVVSGGITTGGSCAAASTTLQNSYTASTGGTTPEIQLDATRTGLDIQDNNTTIGATQALLAVRASATSTTLGNGLFVVNASGKVGINTGSATTTPTLSYDLSLGQGANRTIGVETQATAATAGNNLTLSAGTGNTTGTGGQLALQGGAAGGTGNVNGGTVLIQGGSPSGTGVSGSVTVKANTTDTTTAFIAQNASGSNVLSVDTIANQLSTFGNINLSQIARPASAPTVALGAVGSLTGTFYYTVSYITASGETEYSAASASVSPSAQQVNLTAIPTSPSGLVTARKIYRGSSSFGPFSLVTTLNDNTTTTYSDNVTSLGANASANNTTASLLVGGSVAFNTTGTAGNTFVGLLSGTATTTGKNNTALGYTGLQANTTGVNNTAIGNAALFTNSAGGNNTAIGQSALKLNTSGSFNTASGGGALLNNTTGTRNTASGYVALSTSTTATNNVATGYSTLYNTTTGSNNVATGYSALQSNNTGNNNVAEGYNSLYNLRALSGSITATVNNAGNARFTTGNTAGLLAATNITITGTTSYDGARTVLSVDSGTTFTISTAYSTADATGSWTTANPDNNTSAGYQSGLGNGSGYFALGNSLYGANTGFNLQTGANYNSLFGYSAGSGITTGAQNVLLGYNAGTNLTSGSNNILIGQGATAPVATGSNQLNLGNTLYGDLTNGLIGIGTSTFGTNNKLIVNPYSTLDNLATAQINTSVATNKGLVVQGFAGQTADLQQLQNSSGAILSKFDASGNLSVGTSTSVTGGVATFNGNVGIGTAGPSYNLDVQGTTGLRVKTTTNSTTAFLIQNASAVNLLAADTTNMRLAIGSTGTQTGQLYVGGYLPTAAIGSVATSGSESSLAQKGNYLFSVKNGNILNIYDVSTPTSPVSVKQFTVTGGISLNVVVVSGNYAYIGDGGATKFYVVDISNPLAPVTLGSVSTNANVYNVQVAGKYIYTYNSNNNMQIIDIGNPSAPSVVSTTVLTAYGSSVDLGMVIAGKYLYTTIAASAGNGKLLIYDISNPLSPVLKSTTATASDYHYGLNVQGRYVYVINDKSASALPSAQANNTMQVFDAKDITAPASVGTVTLSGTVTGVPTSPQMLVIRGRTAYFSNISGNTLDIINIANPAAPSLMVATATSTQPVAMTVGGRYAYVENYTGNTIQVFDIGGIYAQSEEVGDLSVNSATVTDSVQVGGSVDIKTGLSVGGGTMLAGDTTINGNAIINSAINNNNAFQVQNSFGGPVIQAGTAATHTNLISNPSFEATTVPAAWTLSGATSIVRTTAGAYVGNYALSINTPATANAGAKYAVALSPSTNYSLSLDDRISGGSGFILDIGYSTDGVTFTNCTGGAYYSNGNEYTPSCNFTTPGSVTSSFIYVRQTDATARTIYIDGIQLYSGSLGNYYYGEGTTQLNGTITSRVVIQPTNENVQAFEILNQGGASVVDVDTAENAIGLLGGNDSNHGYNLTVHGNGNYTGNLGIGLNGVGISNNPSAVQYSLEVVGSGGTHLNTQTFIGSPTTDATQVNLQLDSSSTLSDSGACNATTNQGAMYFNTNSNEIRTCVGTTGWQSTVTSDLMGLQLLGVVPDSGTAPGDLASVTDQTNFAAGPCKVSVGATTANVAWTACTAYSGGRKVIVTAGNAATTNSVAGNFQHLCLTGTNNQPALSTTGAENANLATVSYPSATAPILCLADIKFAAANNTITTIYDTRTYTNIQKEYATAITTAPVLGQLVKSATVTVGSVTATTSATDAPVEGVIVSTTGATSTNTINAIVAVSGPVAVKAISGTNTVSQYLVTSTTAGYGTTAAATSATAYVNLGVAKTAWTGATACAANKDACEGSIISTMRIR